MIYIKYLVIILMLVLQYPQYSHSENTTAVEMEVFFSPEDHVSPKIIEKIQQAKHSIYVLVYSFTDRDISQALIDAHKRGVDVQIIIDGGQTDHYRTQADECKNAGIPVYADMKYKIAHDKVMIFDDQIVLTGSYNISYSADKFNSENVIFVYNETIAKKYKDRWDYRKKYTIEYR